jgi:deazaflavin-dependent oxidoreductase (nitroreductase family)
MTERILDRNVPIVEDFRANEGRVGGPFAGHPMLLLHHRGRSTGTEMVSPLTYQQDPDDPSTIYVFGSAGGRPAHPQWYRNLVAAGEAEVEVGTDRYAVTAEEITGAKRDRIYALKGQDMPGFLEYERNLKGIRTVPVIALHRR